MRVRTWHRLGRVLFAAVAPWFFVPSSVHGAQEPERSGPVAALFKAVLAGDVDAVTTMLRTKRELAHATNEFEQLPLELALQYDYYDVHPADAKHTGHWLRIVRLLIESGADAKAGDGYSGTMLHSAGSKEAAELLLTAGALVDAQSDYGNTPLFAAAARESSEVVAVLLAHGANIDHRDAEGWTAIERSAQDGRTRMVEFLATRGALSGELFAAVLKNDAASLEKLLAAPAEVPGSTKNAALLLAARDRHVDAARALLRAHADPNCLDGHIESVFYVAVNAGSVELAKLLLDSGARMSAEPEGLFAFIDNPLRIAVINKDESMVALLLERGATTHDLERHELEGEPGPTVLEGAVDDGSLAIAKLLLEHGVPPDGRDGSGADPLAVAARKGDKAMVELLLAHGATPRDSDALRESIRRGDAALTEFLLAHGFSPEPGASASSGALQSAVEKKDKALIETLLSRGADPNAIDDARESALDVAVRLGDLALAEFFLEHGAQAEPTDAGDVGPLLIAVSTANPAATKLLLARGADLARRDDEGLCALDLAAARGDIAMIELLRAHAASVKATGDLDATALRAAALGGQKAAVEFLLSHGADPSHLDIGGRAVLDAVIEADQREMKELLIARGAVAALPHSDLLVEAVSKGDVASVNAFLRAEPLPFDAKKDGATLIHIAAAEGRAQVVAVLLAAGAPVDALDYESSTPLLFAANKAVADVLIRAGANADAENDWGLTPLHFAKDLAVARLLLDDGANIEHVDRDGRTPLMWAALAGKIDLMRFLLEHGAKLDALEPDGLSALDAAARDDITASVDFLCSQKAAGSELVAAVRAGDAAAVNRILSGPSAIPAATKSTALLIACKQGRTDLASLALAAHASPHGTDLNGRGPLHFAAAADNVELAELLLNNGAYADAADAKQETPLQIAAPRENRKLIALLAAHGADLDASWWDDATEDDVTHLTRAIDGGSAGFVAFLLEQGASPNVMSQMFASPLRRAIARGDAEVVEALLEHGADASNTWAMGKTFLGSAIDAGNVAIAQALIVHGAQVNEPDPDGHRPLDWAEQTGSSEMSAMLRAHGAFNDALVTELFTAIEHDDGFGTSGRVRELLEAAPEMNQIQRNGDTPLLAAVKHATLFTLGAVTASKPDPNVADASDQRALVLAAGNPLYTAMVLTLAPDVNARNAQSRSTALMMAAKFEGEDARETARILLDHGADVATADAEGATALHYAAQSSDAAMVAYLISRGAPLNARTKAGQTPLWHAGDGNRTAAAIALINAGADLDLADTDLKATPLQLACSVGNVDVVRALIRGGANVNAVAVKNITALFFAVSTDHLECAAQLLEAGANVNVRASDGATPLDVAPNDAIRNLLRSHGGKLSSELR